jgi:ADP-ribose pyrophosphatase
MCNKIVKIKEQLVYSDIDNKWVKLYYDHVRFTNGEEGYYNRIVENDGKQGVAILPIAKGFIGLVRQFRYPISSVVWEIPRGFGETDYPKVDATRELLEETGIRVDPKDIIDLGLVHPNSGLLTSVVRIFAVIFDQMPLISYQTNVEISEFAWIKYEDVLAKVSTGEISDSFTLSALLRAQLKGLL